jgi:hypothetical protein
MLHSDDFNKGEYVMITGSRNPEAPANPLIIGLPLKIRGIQRPFIIVEPLLPLIPVIQVDSRAFVFEKCKVGYIADLTGRKEKVGV